MKLFDRAMVAFSMCVYWVGYDGEEIDTEMDNPSEEGIVYSLPHVNRLFYQLNFPACG